MAVALALPRPPDEGLDVADARLEIDTDEEAGIRPADEPKKPIPRATIA